MASLGKAGALGIEFFTFRRALNHASSYQLANIDILSLRLFFDDVSERLGHSDGDGRGAPISD